MAPRLWVDLDKKLKNNEAFSELNNELFFDFLFKDGHKMGCQIGQC